MEILTLESNTMGFNVLEELLSSDYFGQFIWIWLFHRDQYHTVDSTNDECDMCVCVREMSKLFIWGTLSGSVRARTAPNMK